MRRPPLATAPKFELEFEMPELRPPEFVPPEIAMSSRQKDAACPSAFWKPTELMLLCGNSQLKLEMGMLYFWYAPLICADVRLLSAMLSQ